MKRTCLEPLTPISVSDLDDSYIRLESWDPFFWEKATHVTAESTWEKEDGHKVFHTHFEYYMKASEVMGQLEGGKGYVYILTSKGQSGICKIGSTERTPEIRVKEVNQATGIVLPWELYDAFPCNSPRVVELLVHKALDHVRISKQREGFFIDPEKAKELILKILKEQKSEC